VSRRRVLFPLAVLADAVDLNSHVAKTSDIKDFVITEESGIAKGIRRIIAVTGEEARQASQLASATEARFESIIKLDIKEKDKGLKVFESVRPFLSRYLLALQADESAPTGPRTPRHLGRAQGSAQGEAQGRA
jgi:hypothetical protein